MRELGRTGVLVSEIGLGTAQIGNTKRDHQGVRFIQPKEAQDIIDEAYLKGINYFDTADNYGSAEEVLGKFLQNDHIVKKPFIATKAGLRVDGIRDFSSEYLLSQINRSLNNLNVQSLDLFQLNKPTLSQLIDQRIFSFLNDQKNAKKIKLTGLVVGDIETGFYAIDSGAIDCIQVLYNWMYQDAELLIRYAHEKGIGVIARSPLSSGLLTGGVNESTQFDEGDERGRYFVGNEFLDRVKLLKKVSQLVNIPIEDMLEFSLIFVLSNPNIATVIPGTSRIKTLGRYIRSAYLPKFSSEKLKIIKDAIASCRGNLTFSSQL